MLELAIVMLIVGILAATATPTFFNSLMYHRAESAARRLKADIKQLQQTARRTSRAQSMSFVGSTYTLSSDVVGLNRASEPYTVDLSGSPYEMDRVSFDFGGETTLAFDGYGMPSSGGTAVLLIGTHKRTLTLNGNTGQITITAERQSDDQPSVPPDGAMGGIP